MSPRTLLGAGLALGRAVLLPLVDLLAPPLCAACDAELRGRAVFCAACVPSVIPALPFVADDVAAFALYGGAVAEALRRLKYGGRADLALPLGHLARRVARAASIEADAVVPVPLHPSRLAERGYNQAALLAVEVARELDAALWPRALRRIRHTAQQARLDRAARRDNVAGAFAARTPRAIAGRRLLLVDDVCTTGATLAACAEALHAAGAAEVVSLVVARAE
jgi:ComF family protein